MSGLGLDPHLLAKPFRERTRTVLPVDRQLTMVEMERCYTTAVPSNVKVCLIPSRSDTTLRRQNAVKQTKLKSYLSLERDTGSNRSASSSDDVHASTELSVSQDEVVPETASERRVLFRRMQVVSIGDETEARIISAVRRSSVQYNNRCSVHVIDADEPFEGCPTEVYIVFVTDDNKSRNGSYESVKIPFSNKLTVGHLWTLAAEAFGVDASVLCSEFIMTYSVLEGQRRVKYQLMNEVQFLFQTHLYSCWFDNVSQSGDIPIRIESPPPLGCEEDALMSRICNLIGIVGLHLEPSVQPHSIPSNPYNNEKYNTYLARRTLHSFADEVASERNREEYTLSMDVENTVLNTGIQARIPGSGRKDMHFHFENQDFTESINVYMNANDVLRVIVIPAFFPNEDNPAARSASYCFQLAGEELYVSGDIPLVDFTIMRRLIFREDDIHFLVVIKPSPEKDTVAPSNWPRVDPSVYRICSDNDLHDVNAAIMSHSDLSFVSAWDCKAKFRFTLEGLTMAFSIKNNSLRSDANVDIRLDSAISIHCSLYHGEKCIAGNMVSSVKRIDSRQTILWSEPFTTGIAVRDLPKETKLMVEVKAKELTKETLYWGLINLVDVNNHTLIQGKHVVCLWPVQGRKHSHGQEGPSPVILASRNPSRAAPRLSLLFVTHSMGIVFPAGVPHCFGNSLEKGINTVARQFPLKKLPEMLAHSINWCSMDSVGGLHQVIAIARAKNTQPFEMSFRLLDCDIADEEVRKMAIEKLNVIPIPDMKYYMLQMVQALKFERRHDSPLSRLLLKTALLNKFFGGIFFWCLRSELCQLVYRIRFCILLEAYLKGCGEDMLCLFEEQVKVQDSLQQIGIKVMDMPPEERKGSLDVRLREEKIDLVEFKPLYNPRLSLGNLDIRHCKCMTSKKKPIWLEFRNIDPTSSSGDIRHSMIVKHGDDLRQDMLVLRIMALIDRIWQEDNLDLHLIPYKCIATTCNSGVIEVVRGLTIATVSPNASERSLFDWLKDQCKRSDGDVDLDKFHQTVVTFTKSLAGYSVVTFVLGITDRHNDNIMITKEGNLFHIDFGHILGNVKKFMGVSREWAPFILSPDFMFFMGGPNSVYYESFRKLCVQGFLSLRRRSNIIVNLFALMRHAGIPELSSLEDVKHIQKSLYLDMDSESEAEAAFRGDIDRSLKLNWTTVLNWWAHLKKKNSGS